MTRTPTVRTALAATLVLVGTLGVAACGNDPATHGVRPSGSTRFFLDQLDHADASADYVTIPLSLADSLPNTTFRVLPGASRPDAKPYSFRWSERVVVGRVLAVHLSREDRVLLTIRVEESFPATKARTLDVRIAGFADQQGRYLASAASLKRVVVGIDRYRDDDGTRYAAVAMASQFLGTVDADDRITWPVLGRGDFKKARWNAGVDTLAGLRRTAGLPARTIDVRTG